MFENHPVVKGTLRAIAQIVLGIVSIVAAIVIVKRLLLPSILIFVELSEVQLHAVSGLGELVFVSLAYLAYIRFYEKRRTIELAFDGRNMLYGAISGVAIVSVTTLSLFAMGYYEIVTYQALDEMLLVLVALSAQAVVGEFIFRGIFFRIIERQVGTVYSLVLVSVAYGLLNILVDGPNPIVMVSTMLISALWCGVYILSRNLWVVGLHAAGWLYAIFAIGILDEHWRASAPIISNYNGPPLLTGGAFGPDASIISIVVVSIFLFLVLRIARQKDRFIRI